MNNTRRKIAPPRTLYTISGEVGDESELTQASLDAASLIRGKAITLDRCRLNRTRILGAEMVRVMGTHLDTVDAANATLEHSSWRASHIVESRWTGAIVNFAHISECVWEACQMGHVQMQECTLKSVRFESCDLRGAYFNRTDLQGTVFVGSNLTSADFSGANISGCDFRRANIESIRIAPEQLQGVIVTPDQALYLARLLGLDVRE